MSSKGMMTLIARNILNWFRMFFLGLLIVSVTAHYFLERYYLRAQLSNEVKILMDLVATSTANLVLTEDKESLGRYFETLNENTNLAYVRIVNETGALLGEWKNPDAEVFEEILKTDIEVKGQIFGRVTVALDQRGLNKSLQAHLVTHVVVITILSFLMYFVLSFLVRRKAIYPLSIIYKQASLLGDGVPLSRNLELPRAFSEIDKVMTECSQVLISSRARNESMEHELTDLKGIMKGVQSQILVVLEEVKTVKQGATPAAEPPKEAKTAPQAEPTPPPADLPAPSEASPPEEALSTEVAPAAPQESVPEASEQTPENAGTEEVATAPQEEKPAEEAKPAEEVKPAEEIKATEEAQVVEATKPAEEPKATEDAKATEETKPAEQAPSAEAAKQVEAASVQDQASVEAAPASEEVKEVEPTAEEVKVAAAEISPSATAQSVTETPAAAPPASPPPEAASVSP